MDVKSNGTLKKKGLSYCKVRCALFMHDVHYFFVSIEDGIHHGDTRWQSMSHDGKKNWCKTKLARPRTKVWDWNLSCGYKYYVSEICDGTLVDIISFIRHNILFILLKINFFLYTFTNLRNLPYITNIIPLDPIKFHYELIVCKIIIR